MYIFCNFYHCHVFVQPFMHQVFVLKEPICNYGKSPAQTQWTKCTELSPNGKKILGKTRNK